MSTKDPSEKKKIKDAYANFAADIQSAVEEDKDAKKEILRKGIEERERKEGASILQSKILKGKVSELRGKAGLSAFVGTSGKIKSPKFRRDEFLALLARELLLIGTEELSDKGGIISLNRLKAYFNDTRKNWELRDNDILEAIELLKKEQLIPYFDKINEEIQLIYFKPIELSDDTQKIMIAAYGIEVTREKLKNILGWTQGRLDTGLKQLESMGLAVLDEEYVYFPGL